VDAFGVSQPVFIKAFNCADILCSSYCNFVSYVIFDVILF